MFYKEASDSTLASLLKRFAWALKLNDAPADSALIGEAAARITELRNEIDDLRRENVDLAYRNTKLKEGHKE